MQRDLTWAIGLGPNRHSKDRATANATATATVAAINALLMALRFLRPQLFLFLFQSLLLFLQSSTASNLANNVMMTNQSSSVKSRRRNI